jgi:hypothetical protein
MSARGAATWTCPWCERLVPAREARCHCGCDRAVAEAKDAAEGQGEGQGAGPIVGRAALVIGLLAACGLVLFVAFRQRSRSLEAAALAERESLPPPSAPIVASTGPPPTYGDIRSGGGYAPPAVWISAAPPVEVPAAPLAPSPKAAEAASPTTSTMEEEWEKASTLLEPRLQKMATDSRALEASYYPFAARCLAPDGGGSRGADGSWLSSLKSAPAVGGIQFTEAGGNVDCASARARLLAKANQVKSELSAAEELARTSRVLPGHWRKLVATHQLEIWDRY